MSLVTCIFAVDSGHLITDYDVEEARLKDKEQHQRFMQSMLKAFSKGILGLFHLKSWRGGSGKIDWGEGGSQNS